MTALKIRKIPFTFDETVPFQWLPGNPRFGADMVGVGLLAIGFEKYIVRAVREAMPLLEEPDVIEEAQAFLRQEAVHAAAHRAHAHALIARYPGLQSVLDEVVRSYDELYAARSLHFHLAYIAALEATFTPFFKALLDNRDQLFTPGDSRVASLFEWHFVEEVEHRSSGLIVYDAVVGNPWYRLAVAPRAAVHSWQVMGRIRAGFQEHVPAEDRLVSYSGGEGGALRRLAGRLPLVRRRIGSAPAAIDPYAAIPARERRALLGGLLRSQLPGHDPEHQPLPAFAQEWFAAYDRGEDMTVYGGTAPAATPAVPT